MDITETFQRLVTFFSNTLKEKVLINLDYNLIKTIPIFIFMSFYTSMISFTKINLFTTPSNHQYLGYYINYSL